MVVVVVEEDELLVAEVVVDIALLLAITLSVEVEGLEDVVVDVPLGRLLLENTTDDLDGLVAGVELELVEVVVVVVVGELIASMLVILSGSILETTADSPSSACLLDSS